MLEFDKTSTPGKLLTLFRLTARVSVAGRLVVVNNTAALLIDHNHCPMARDDTSPADARVLAPRPPNELLERGRDEADVELENFNEHPDVSSQGRQQETSRKKARILVASAILQLPIWGTPRTCLIEFEFRSSLLL